MTKISYVVTVYNKEKFLKDVIQSIKDQTGDFEREYVFINDGSTDGSWDVVHAETAALENVVLVEQENQGVAIATNRAIEKATGDYIKLVDSDDILAPFATELLLETVKKSGCHFVFAISGEYMDAPVFTPQSDPQFRRFPDALFTVIDRGYARVSHSLFKKDMFDQVGGCDERVFSQDHSLFIRLSALGELAQIMETVCLSPADEPGRIMNNDAQVIHDHCLALALFIDDGQRFRSNHKKAVQKKIVSRMWKWAKKHHGAGIFSVEFLIYLMGRMGWPYSPKLLIDLCAIFRKNAKVRRP